MDTCTQAVRPKRRHLELEKKRRIVEETLAEGASVAEIARTHGLNANLVFNWRKLYRAGQLGSRGEAELLPVQVTPESFPLLTSSAPAANHSQSCCEGTIHIQLPGGRVRVEGRVDAGLMRVVLECLRG